MLKAIIVDDHPFIRSAVGMILQQENYEIVAETDNGTDAIRLTRELQPNLVVLDITMPGVDGLIVLSRISALKLPVKVLVLTSLSAVFFSMRCMRAGAAGYVSKAGDMNEMVKAITAIKLGYTFFPDLTMNSVRRKDIENSEQDLINNLSDRELSILRLLAKGLDNKEIAAQLILSNKTISTYKSRIIEKLNLSSVVHLSDMAKRNNLV
jgi:two-component system response regulator EvgA